MNYYFDMQLKRLEKKEIEENEEMMSNVSPELKQKILSDYYSNMYEDEDADQEYFDSIRNVNHEIEEGDDGERWE